MCVSISLVAWPGEDNNGDVPGKCKLCSKIQSLSYGERAHKCIFLLNIRAQLPKTC
jgi:hypothetical protein